MLNFLLERNPTRARNQRFPRGYALARTEGTSPPEGISDHRLKPEHSRIRPRLATRPSDLLEPFGARDRNFPNIGYKETERWTRTFSVGLEQYRTRATGNTFVTTRGSCSVRSRTADRFQSRILAEEEDSAPSPQLDRRRQDATRSRVSRRELCHASRRVRAAEKAATRSPWSLFISRTNWSRARRRADCFARRIDGEARNGESEKTGDRRRASGESFRLGARESREPRLFFASPTAASALLCPVPSRPSAARRNSPLATRSSCVLPPSILRSPLLRLVPAELALSFFYFFDVPSLFVRFSVLHCQQLRFHSLDYRFLRFPVVQAVLFSLFPRFSLSLSLSSLVSSRSSRHAARRVSSRASLSLSPASSPRSVISVPVFLF